MYPDKWLIEWTSANGQVARETARNDAVCEGVLLRLRRTIDNFETNVRVILIEGMYNGTYWLHTYGTTEGASR